MADISPAGIAVCTIGGLFALGITLLAVMDGPRQFADSIRRGFTALRFRWHIYLLDSAAFFSLAASLLGLVVTGVALGAVVWLLLRGPAGRLGDVRLFLPFGWTAVWIVLFFICQRASERLRAEERY